jgi:hypothetical protein
VLSSWVVVPTPVLQLPAVLCSVGVVEVVLQHLAPNRVIARGLQNMNIVNTQQSAAPASAAERQQ